MVNAVLVELQGEMGDSIGTVTFPVPLPQHGEEIELDNKVYQIQNIRHIISDGQHRISIGVVEIGGLPKHISILNWVKQLSPLALVIVIMYLFFQFSPQINVANWFRVTYVSALIVGLTASLLQFPSLYQRKLPLEFVVTALVTIIELILMFALIDYFIFITSNPAHPAFFVSNGGLESWTFLYYSITTFTSTGYGDIIPIVPIARDWASAEMIIGWISGTVIMALMVTKITSYSKRLKTSKLKLWLSRWLRFPKR